SDTTSAKRFFTDVLGLTVERDSPTFVQFLAPNGTRYAIASDQPMERADAPELWWTVEDADSAYAEMSARSEVAMPLKEMPFGRCFGIKDPAGQVHYVLEFAPQRPSEPV